MRGQLNNRIVVGSTPAAHNILFDKIRICGIMGVMDKKKANKQVKPIGNPNIGKEGEPYQWKPGQSGNPAGPPPAKTQLYRYWCKFLAMSPKELAKVDESKLTLAEVAALKSARLMDWQRQQEIINRDEGKVPDRIAGPEGEPLKFYSGVDQEKV